MIGKILRHVNNSLRYRTSRVSLPLIKALYELPEVELQSFTMNTQIDVASPILDDICLPPYYAYNDHDDFLPLMRIAKTLDPKVVVELGTAYGNTVANICQQCPLAKIYTVNASPEEISGTLTTYSLSRSEIGRVYRAYGYKDRVVQIFSNTLSLDLANYFDGPIVDLAIIDACHDTKYVLNDFYKLQGFIKKQGVILFHDTHPSMQHHLEGSYKACMLLRARGYDIRHIKNTWWAIWVNDDARS